MESPICGPYPIHGPARLASKMEGKCEKKMRVDFRVLENLSQRRNGRKFVDPTRSAGRRDSLLKWKENVKRKCGLIFEFWKIRPKGGTVLLWSRHLLLSLFLNVENQVRTKNPNDSSMEKKRSAKTKFLGPGIRLPIRKVLHMR